MDEKVKFFFSIIQGKKKIIYKVKDIKLNIFNNKAQKKNLFNNLQIKKKPFKVQEPK